MDSAEARRFLAPGEGMVTVLVGRDKKDFKIHKALLCHYSTYFKAAFTGSFKEAEEGKVTLVEEDPEVFRVFMVWLYTAELIDDQENKLYLTKTDDMEQDHRHYMLLLDLYILADSRGIPNLRTTIVDSVIGDCTGALPSDLTVARAFDRLPKGSPMRSLLVDMYAYSVDFKNDGSERLPREFLLDVLRVISERMRKGAISRNDAPPYKVKSCRYHGHDTEGEAEACREKRWTLEKKIHKPRRT